MNESRHDPLESADKHHLILMVMVFALGVLVQIQETVELYKFRIRLNFADVYLIFVAIIFTRTVFRSVRKFFFEASVYFLAALAFFIFLISVNIATVALEQVVSGQGLVKYIGVFVLFAYLFTGYVFSSVDRVHVQHCIAASVVGFQVVIVGLYTITLLQSTEGMLSVGPRMGGFAQNANTQGLFFVCGLALSLGYGRKLWPGNIGRYLCAAFSAILLLGIIYTGSLAAVIAAIAVLSTYFVIFYFSWKKLFLLCIFAAVAAPLMVVSLKPGVFNPQTFLGKIADLKANIIDGTECAYFKQRDSQFDVRDCTYYSAIQVRLDGYRNALEFWKEHPWFGGGLGTYVSSREGADNSQSQPQIIHNTFLWWLAEAGVFGLFAIMALYFAISRNIYRNIGIEGYRDRVFDPFFVSLILVAVGWFTMSAFHELTYQRIIWVLAGFGMARASNTRSVDT